MHVSCHQFLRTCACFARSLLVANFDSSNIHFEFILHVLSLQKYVPTWLSSLSMASLRSRCCCLPSSPSFVMAMSLEAIALWNALRSFAKAECSASTCCRSACVCEANATCERCSSFMFATADKTCVCSSAVCHVISRQYSVCVILGCTSFHFKAVLHLCNPRLYFTSGHVSSMCVYYGAAFYVISRQFYVFVIQGCISLHFTSVVRNERQVFKQKGSSSLI